MSDRREGVARPEVRHRRRRARPSGRARRGDRGGSGWAGAFSLRRSARARPPRDRSPDEALHEAPNVRPDPRRRRPRRVQRRHRLPHRAGPAPALAEARTARAAAVRSPRGRLRRRGGAHAGGEPGPPADRCDRGAAAPAPRAGRGDPADARAAHPPVAGGARARAGMAAASAAPARARRRGGGGGGHLLGRLHVAQGLLHRALAPDRPPAARAHP